MKKNYIQPSTISVKVMLNRFIAVSTNSISNVAAAAGSEDSPVNEGRRGSSSFWDDEE